MPQLRILHIGLSLTAVLVTLTLGALRSFGPASTGALPPLLTWVLLGLAGMTILSAATVRSSIPAAEADQGDDSWVSTNRTRCLMVWVLLEGGVTLCAIALFLGANPWTAGALAAGGLGFLASQSPGTLAGH